MTGAAEKTAGAGYVPAGAALVPPALAEGRVEVAQVAYAVRQFMFAYEALEQGNVPAAKGIVTGALVQLTGKMPNGAVPVDSFGMIVGQDVADG